MNPRVLITGGAGFIGSHIVEHYQAKAEVVVLDDFRSGYRANLAGLDCRVVAGSILDAAALADAMKGVTQVFHMAAMISVPESVQKPEECARLNVEGTRLVLEEALHAGVQRVILASSAAIYGDNPVVPKLESMSPEPKSPYASTKLDGEILLEEFRINRNLSTASLRFFNVFGPRQDPRSAYAAAVPTFIERALRHQPIIIHGDGEQTRDFIYVKDIVGALVHAAGHPEINGTFNVGYGQSVSIRALAEEIIRLTNSHSFLEFLPERLGDVKHSLASADRLKATGWKPAFTVSRGLAASIEGYRRLKA